VSTIKVEGLEALGKRLQTLSNDVAKKAARAATQAAATIVRKGAQRNIKALGLVDTGNMMAAVGVQRSKRTRLTSEHRVGVKSGRGSRGGDLIGGRTEDVRAAKAGTGKLGVDAYYWRFLELGTVKRGATPFLGPALADNQVEAIEAMKRKLKERIDKAGKP
jgi:HK97 gp10 family phage protein